jgi:hypothetical protein
LQSARNTNHWTPLLSRRAGRRFCMEYEYAAPIL